MKKCISRIAGSLLILTALACPVLPLFAAIETISELSLLDKESRFEKEKGEYLQQYVLDKILGPGKAIVIVDVQLGIETKTMRQEARERKAEKKKRLGEVDYLLPGVPNPKSVAQEGAPGETKEETGQAEDVRVEVTTVIKKQLVTVLHDERLDQERLDMVRDAIVSSLKMDPKRGDKTEFKKTRFTQGFLEELFMPKVLIPVILALLLLFFLFGPLASFLRSYVRTMREKGGTEVMVDSKFEGGPEDGKGGAGGGGGAISPAELEALEKEKKRYQPFEYINDDNLKRMVYLIRKEPAQTIALVVSYLKSEYVREVLNALSPELQARVALEMATIRSMTEEQVRQVDEYIKEKIEFLIGGLFHLLEVLDTVDKVTQVNILDYLKNENPDLYEKVRKHIIMFEDIPNFPDQAMQTIIRELKTPDLARALRNSPPDILNKFYSNMSANAVAILKEEMEYGRPLTADEVEDERRNILNLIKQMEKDGKIVIRERQKNDMLEGIENTPEAEADAPQGLFGDYYQAGVQYYEAGQYEDALSYFEYCTQLDPAQDMAYRYLGNTYFTMGRPTEAVAAFEKALELKPEDQELKQWLSEQKNTIRQ
ncbi:MAG: FliG C-terminal domain-containing protein [Endomicrobiales bacterium]